MKRSAVLLSAVLVLLAGSPGCSKHEERPLSEPGEKLYTLRGVVLSRETTSNTLEVEHEAIPNFMAAMTMEFPVRGADVAELPPDRSRIEARLHFTDRAFWLTDVRQLP